MNWRDETIPKLDRETQTKNFIKNELMNYYFYLEKINEYQKIVDMYEDELSNPSVGGSVIVPPNSFLDNTSRQEHLTNNKMDAESNLRYYQYKLDVLDSWMNVLTESQHDIVKQYIMKYQCKNAQIAGDKIGYREVTVKMQTKRAINRIYSKISEFI